MNKQSSEEFQQQQSFPTSPNTNPKKQSSPRHSLATHRNSKPYNYEPFRFQRTRRSYISSVISGKELSGFRAYNKLRNQRDTHLATYTSGFKSEKQRSLLPNIDKDKQSSSADELPILSRKQELRTVAKTMNLQNKKSQTTVTQQVDSPNQITVYGRPRKPQQITGPKKISNLQLFQSNLRIQFNKTATTTAAELVEYYTRKLGLKNLPVFIFNSQDEYIRRILLYWGWIQNKIFDSPFFTLKWSYKDSLVDYTKVVPGQLLNHYKNNQQLTSKGRLLVNLKYNQNSTATSHDQYFPASFDLGNPIDLEQFNIEYEKSIAFIILRKTYNLIEQKLSKEQFNRLKRQSQQKIERRQKGYYVKSDKHWLISNNRFSLMKFEDYRHRREDFLVQTNFCSMALKFIRNIKREHKIDCKQKPFHLLHFKKQQWRLVFPQLVKYSALNPPYSPSREAELTKEYFATPSLLLIKKVIYYFTYFSKKYAHVWQAQGLHNIWVIKPANNSRGNGIHLQTQRSQIVNVSEGLGSRIVQKYIEHPLIITNPIYPQLCNKKFDIRQWVLVTSYIPLKVYRFSQCYLRICSESYDITQIKALQRHLTNYSFNKLNFTNKSDSALSINTFQHILKEQCGVDWRNQILPKIDSIIGDVIQRSCENIQNSAYCFQLYGFDILIDSQFNPWLLEVNMSPACEQRCQFLKDYCEVMGEKLLRLVLPQQYLPKVDVPHLNSHYGQYHWVCILQKQTHFQRKDIDLEIYGTSVNLRKEKQLDRKYHQSMAALKIQTNFKMIKAMRILKKAKNQKYTKILQKYMQNVNRHILTHKLQQSSLINTIQRYMLVKINEVRAKPLHRQYFIKNCMQPYLKGLSSLSNFKKEQICQSIRTIQQVYAHYKHVQNIVERRYKLCCIKIIQKFYKQRFVTKNKAAATIQKAAKLFIYKVRRQRFIAELLKAKNSQTIGSYLKSFLASQRLKLLLRAQSIATVKAYITGKIQTSNFKKRALTSLCVRVDRARRNYLKQLKESAYQSILNYIRLKQHSVRIVQKYFLTAVIQPQYKCRRQNRARFTIGKFLKSLLQQHTYEKLHQGYLLQELQTQKLSRSVKLQHSESEYPRSEQLLENPSIKAAKDLGVTGSVSVESNVFNKYLDFISKSNKYLSMRASKRQQLRMMLKKPHK